MTYRQTAVARSASIEQLAVQARTAQRAGTVPCESHELPDVEAHQRLELAVGVHEDRGSFWLGILCALIWLVALSAARVALQSHGDSGGPAVAVSTLFAFATSIACFRSSDAASRRREHAIDEALAWAEAQPFQITGYRDWLVSDVPMMNIRLRAPIDLTLFRDAMTAIDPAITSTIVDDRTVSVVIPAREMAASKNTSARRFGDIQCLAAVFARCVVPLHAEVGVERIAMGGTVRPG